MMNKAGELRKDVEENCVVQDGESIPVEELVGLVNGHPSDGLKD